MPDDFAAAEAGILTYRIPVLVEVGDDCDFGATGQQAAALFKPAFAEIPARAAFLLTALACPWTSVRGRDRCKSGRAGGDASPSAALDRQRRA